ncbi:hypothetical protein Tco_1463153 [Tanacetum coccineum]
MLGEWSRAKRVSPCSSSSATHSSSPVFAGPSRKRCRPPTTDSPLIRADLLPLRKRLRDPLSAYDRSRSRLALRWTLRIELRQGLREILREILRIVMRHILSWILI